MNSSNVIKLPSNKTFGFFFSFIFLLVFFYFFFLDNKVLSLFFLLLFIIFFIVTLVKSSLLLPLNKIWMHFGFLLGKVISPFILGIIFFGLFVPTAFLLRIIKRDLLGLKFLSRSSYWINRNKSFKSEDFKQQF